MGLGVRKVRNVGIGSLLFVIVRYCSLLFVKNFTVRYCSLLFVVVRHCSLLFVIVRCCSLLFVIWTLYGVAVPPVSLQNAVYQLNGGSRCQTVHTIVKSQVRRVRGAVCARCVTTTSPHHGLETRFTHTLSSCKWRGPVQSHYRTDVRAAAATSTPSLTHTLTHSLTHTSLSLPPPLLLPGGPA